VSIDNAIASVAVKDLRVAVQWYEALLGRKPDSVPMPEVARAIAGHVPFHPDVDSFWRLCDNISFPRGPVCPTLSSFEGVQCS